MHRILLTGVLAAAAANPAAATTWFVNPDGSGDFPTIQAALDAADDGDEILLGDGTFTGEGNRDLRYLGKAVTVRSASGDAAACVIDGEDLHSYGFRFLGDEGPPSVLEDVTVTRTRVTALDLSDASPTIRNVIVRNFRETAVHTQGGAPRLEGLQCRDGGSPAVDLSGGAPILSGCLLEANTLVSSRGALELSGSDATLERCTIRDQVRGDLSYTVAVDIASGNVVLRDCEILGNPVSALLFDASSPATLTLERCLVEDNDGGAVRFSMPAQGPLGTLVLRDCVLRRSGAATGIGVRLDGRADAVLERCTVEGFGYGLWGAVNGGTSTLSLAVRDCRIRNNAYSGVYSRTANVEIDDSEIRGNGTEAAILLGHGQLSVRSSLIVENGRGLQLRTFASAIVERCTIASNGPAATGGGIEILSPAGSLRLSRTIVWGNCAADASEIVVPAGGSLDLDCVDLDVSAIHGQGTVTVSGEVLGTDPLFCAPGPCGPALPGGLYTLQRNSPASLAECGSIGALGIGCEAPTSVESALELRSWGAIKSLYR